MIFFPRKKFIVVVLAIFSASISAQEIVPINSEDVTRMGIVFAPAIPVDTSTGARYAATVSKPDNTLGRYIGFMSTHTRAECK